jgi:hypothetical protein
LRTFKRRNLYKNTKGETVETKKQKIEQKIFKRLDQECRPYSTPVPDMLFDMPVKCEIFGFMSRMIGEAFENMRQSGGKSNWECDAKVVLGSKVSEKRVVTVNTLRKYISECQSSELIDFSKEEDGKFIIKLNVAKIFEDCQGDNLEKIERIE